MVNSGSVVLHTLSVHRRTCIDWTTDRKSVNYGAEHAFQQQVWLSDRLSFEKR